MRGVEGAKTDASPTLKIAVRKAFVVGPTAAKTLLINTPPVHSN